MSALEHKIAYSIALLRRGEALALRMSPDGYHLAFSGGKDSMVLYHLAKMAGVKFKAHMQVTTIDPPELMQFVRANYPDVVFVSFGENPALPDPIDTVVKVELK